MFFLKKLIQALFLPASFIFILLVLALVLIVLRRKLGKVLLFFTIAIYYLLSITPVSHSLLRGLENRYAVVVAAPDYLQHVVVLGGGDLNSLSGLPPTSRLRPSSLARITEGIRLFNQLEDGYLVTSGGSWSHEGRSGSSCVQMKNLAVSFGVDEQRIISECNSRDTHEEAREIKKILTEEPFLLVTSGYHMRRAMYIFEKLGMNPQAAPCEMKAQSKGKYVFRDYIPAFWVLENSSLALNEYAGLLFYRFLK
jgi:uncharacterized SAM-binding protein YcdF (DUF218 family)